MLSSQLFADKVSSYKKINFSNESIFFESLSYALSDDLTAKEVKKAIKVFKINQDIKNFKDTKSLMVAQPTSAKTIISNVQIAGLSNKNGTIAYKHKTLDLNPTGRQLDFSFGYTKDFGEKTTVSTQFTITKDAGHQILNQQKGSVYFGLLREGTFGNDKINLGAVLSDTISQNTAKLNYSINW